MPGVIPRFKTGPITYQVAEAVKGGQLVEARAASKIGVAAAGSFKVLGVATKDARPPQSGASVDADGFPVQSLVEITDNTAVDDNGWYPLTYAANAAFGDALIAAANGQVTPAGAAPDARSIVGYCAEPAGVVAGAVGLTRLGR